MLVPQGGFKHQVKHQTFLTSQAIVVTGKVTTTTTQTSSPSQLYLRGHQSAARPEARQGGAGNSLTSRQGPEILRCEQCYQGLLVLHCGSHSMVLCWLASCSRFLNKVMITELYIPMVWQPRSWISIETVH
ncbi:hypothetical protein GWK47_016821 [Chionoecetes opilio]|uniref:Uncharacterized protein n=1 Tax=Chionoecetes opilio TaxID=41210 RepID=A0A8J4XRA5_CHIOP|nr:hypothetical protein GWK47_016821 [Chionoecetes opilio]